MSLYCESSWALNFASSGSQLISHFSLLEIQAHFIYVSVRTLDFLPLAHTDLYFFFYHIRMAWCNGEIGESGVSPDFARELLQIQDPNTWKVKKKCLFKDNTQCANFQGKFLFKATKQQMVKNEMQASFPLWVVECWCPLFGRMLRYHKTKFCYKRFSGSEDIVWTNIYRSYEQQQSPATEIYTGQIFWFVMFRFTLLNQFAGTKCLLLVYSNNYEVSLKGK